MIYYLVVYTMLLAGNLNGGAALSIHEMNRGFYDLKSCEKAAVLVTFENPQGLNHNYVFKSIGVCVGNPR